jgi:integrase
MVNRSNYRWVNEHLQYLEEVKQLDRRSVGRYWSYLRHLLLWADGVLLSRIVNVRPTFPSYLKNVRAYGDGDPLAPESLKKIVNTSKRFFIWAKLVYPSEFRSVTRAWIDTLVAPRRDGPPAPDHEFVTLEEAILLATLEIDEDNLALRRDRAGVSMLYLSGMRGGALASLPIEAVDVDAREVRQWPSLGVRTKGRKSATTYLLEIPQLLTVVREWDAFVRAQLPPTAMWYTPTVSKWGQQKLSTNAPGDNRNVALAKRVRKLFAAAGLPYKSPHKFRHGHAVYGLLRARDMADYKAVSMNLMHATVDVTDGIYAPPSSDEVRRRITQMSERSSTPLPAGIEPAALSCNVSNAYLVSALGIAAERLSS